jgi:hypothetical protein
MLSLDNGAKERPPILFNRVWVFKKKNSETVMEFIQRFNKLYNKIPVEVKPSQPAAKVTFAGAFEPDFALLLRERRGLP